LSLPPRGEATGFVLAGGRSSRMGQDKALLDYAGQPLIVRALNILHEAGLERAIAGGGNSLATAGRIIEDAGSYQGKGPLSGICAGLEWTAAQHAVFLPVDMPLLPSSLIAYLVAYARSTESLITMAAVNGTPQPFPVVIEQRALPRLKERLKSGERGCLNSFEYAAKSLGGSISILQAELLVQSGQVSHSVPLPAAFWFINLNSPEDVKRALSVERAALQVS
jgi:molybdenum cofactor guanylyltransferase